MAAKKNTGPDADEISTMDVLLNIKIAMLFLKKKWQLIVLFGLIGAVLGLTYATIKKPVYDAQCTFVLDDGGGRSSVSQYAGLASLAGISMGGDNGSLFQADNILQLYTSRLMIEKTLLSPADFGEKKELLVDRYINFNKLRSRWKEHDHIDSITFYGDPEKFNRKQDSIITDLTEIFNKKYLTVSKPDKKLSIIQVDVASKDELFAQLFAGKLVENVNAFYIDTKTKKLAENVKILQRQADSVHAQLNGSIGGVATAIDAAPNANPLLQSLRVPSQRKQVDVQASSAIYNEVVTNLEIAKMSLLQETPLIQVIDKPILPLRVDRVTKFKGVLLGAILGAIIVVIGLLAIKTYKIIRSI